MKTLKSSKILVALMATTVFMILPTVVMALTDTQTTSGAGNNALPAANGNNGMNAGNPPIQANPAANNNPNQQSNMNAQRANSNDALVKSKNTPPNNPAGTNR